MEKEIYISKEGLKKLKLELAEIESVKLKDMAEKIARAKDMGDLSENAEYHEAKRQQSFLFGRAKNLKYKIENAKLIEKSSNNDKIVVGCKVKVKTDGKSQNFEIVGSDEADPANGRISADSPIGSSILGHKVGDTIKVQTPAGEIEYQVVSIK